MAKTRLSGKVISNKMEKTIVVLVERKVRHPKYKKTVVRHKKYYAHCEETLKIGQIVTIEYTKPISKLVNWKVVPDKLKKQKKAK